jgi:hypothetical protein
MCLLRQLVRGSTAIRFVIKHVGDAVDRNAPQFRMGDVVPQGQLSGVEVKPFAL